MTWTGDMDGRELIWTEHDNGEDVYAAYRRLFGTKLKDEPVYVKTVRPNYETHLTPRALVVFQMRDGTDSIMALRPGENPTLPPE